MSRSEIITLGCRLNLYESEMMMKLAQQYGLDDAVIVNSCAVTQAAQMKSRQAVRRAKRDHPAKRVFVTGCASDIAAGEFAAMKEVDGIIKNKDKNSAKVFSSLAARPKPAANTKTTHASLIKQSRVRAMLKVQDGCDWQCTFCVIPQGRGTSRSRLSEDVVREAKDLYEAGHCEITLTGVDITSYGNDLAVKTPLGSLVENILAATPSGLKLRLSSLDPAAIDPLLFSLLASEPRLQPHIHLSVQSGDNMILKRMRRRHCRQDVMALCESLRKRRAVSLGADLIAGFPTETDEMFEQTRALMKSCAIIFAHIFPFSPRPNTPAARMPPTDPQIAHTRARTLRQDAEAGLKVFLDSQIGSVQSVLAETALTGRTDFYARAHWDDQSLEAGRVYQMKIKKRHQTTLIVALHQARG